VDTDARVIERWTPSLATPDLRRDEVRWTPRGAALALTIDVRRFFEERCRLPRWT
jgi:hypothetical protein